MMLFMIPNAPVEGPESFLDVFAFGICLLSISPGNLPSAGLILADRNRSSVVLVDGSSRLEPTPEVVSRKAHVESAAEGYPLEPIVLPCRHN